MDFDFRVEGAAEMQRALSQLSAVGQATVLAEGVKKASEPMVRAAKGRAPSPVIADGVRFIDVVHGKNGSVTAKVGLPGGRKPWFYGLFIERGTGPRIQKTTGRRTGSMPAKPWMRPAFASARKASEAAFARYMQWRLNQVARHGGL